MFMPDLRPRWETMVLGTGPNSAGRRRQPAMRAAVVCLSALGLVLTGAVAAEAQEPPGAEQPLNGEELYQQRCSSCHESGSRSIPTRAMIARHTPEDILDILTTGFMAAVASFMTEDEKLTLARHLSSQPPPSPPASGAAQR